jgi:hypothetical protein
MVGYLVVGIVAIGLSRYPEPRAKSQAQVQYIARDACSILIFNFRACKYFGRSRGASRVVR